MCIYMCIYIYIPTSFDLSIVFKGSCECEKV